MKKVRGVGINDTKEKVCRGSVNHRAHTTWYNMLNRCYGDQKGRNASYVGCSVCDEWLYFSNFLSWYNENYKEGYDLDKDLLHPGNKVYSPTTCVFVHPKLNKMLMASKACRGEYPTGISRRSNGKFFVEVKFTDRKLRKTIEDLDEAIEFCADQKHLAIQECIAKYADDEIIDVLQKRWTREFTLEWMLS